ncbi:MAG: cytochrome c biogenesis protein CcsA [Candidatus Bathyarchaeota archaeon]
MSLFSKIFASWGGARGSMLFLALILSIFYIIIRIKTKNNRNNYWIFATIILNIILLVFLIVALVKNPFEQFSVNPIEGRGLNPQLQTFWMIIHPPIIFGAYACVLLSFSLTLSTIKNNLKYSSLKLLKISTIVAWLLLTIGISLGGVWAYEVLGWGGYWAWDPVETASLLPWLFLTAMFFLNPVTKKDSHSQEFMILLTFASLVFLSALTRGGSTQSVHSYAISPVGPIMMAFAIGMIIYFFYIQRSKNQSLFRMEDYSSSVHSRSAFITFWSLILIAIVCFIGLGFQNFSYNYYTFPFVLSLIIGLIGYSLNEKTPYVRVILITISGLITGFFISLIFKHIHILASLAIPLVTITVFMTIYNIFRLKKQKLINILGRKLINLGIILILLGVLISAGAKNSENLINLELNSPTEINGLTIEVTDVSVGTSHNTVYFEQLDELIAEYSYLRAKSTFNYNGAKFYKNFEADYYPNYGLVIRPQIISTVLGDLYIHLDFTENMTTSLIEALREEIVIPETLNFTIQTSPMIYLLWIGIITIVLGIGTELFIEIKQPSKKIFRF